MPLVTIIFGLILVTIGLEGYTNQLGVFNVQETYSKTSLIPAGVGAFLASCGIFSLYPSMRKHMMHVAAMIGFLGTGAGLYMGGRGLPSLLQGTAERPSAIKMQLTMGVVCLVFLILCIRSFIQARRRRNAARL